MLRSVGHGKGGSKAVGAIWRLSCLLTGLLVITALTLAAAPQAARGEEFLFKWGSQGTGNGQFNNPKAIAVDATGNVYVADSSNNRIQKFDSAGVFIASWGSTGLGNGQFRDPRGIAVDAWGKVYVADTGNHRIQKFDSNGVFQTRWGGDYTGFSYGDGNGLFYNPVGIAVDASGNVYVADFTNKRIQKFDSNGVFITKWTRGSNPFSPVGIAVDASGNVYVMEANRGIQKFDSNGVFLATFAGFGYSDGQFSEGWSIGVDAFGNVYGLNKYLPHIQKFDSNGVLLAKWGSDGSGDGQLIDPQGIAVRSLNSLVDVYVADTFNNRIQVFGIPLIANAGPDQGPWLEGTLVQLNGANSTPAIEIATYQWEKISGPDVTLSNAAIAQPTFYAPEVGPGGATLEFRLTVTSYAGKTSQDTCIVNVVNPPNQAPVTNAGDDQTVLEGTLVTLNGTGTDPNGDPLTYSWTQLSEPWVTLSGSGTLQPSFTAPEVGPGGATLTFQLRVRDPQGLEAIDTCIVNVSSVNQPPVANAGNDQVVNEGVQVTLQGYGNDPDGTAVTFRWTQTSGPPVTLGDPTAAQPTFTAPNVTQDQELVFELTVSDGSLQGTDGCKVAVRRVNNAPAADAQNNLTILSQEQNGTVLSGTASDADGDSLSYRWLEGTTELYGWQPVAAGQTPLALSTAPPLGVGAHTLTLEITDGYATSRDEMLLTIGNSPPTVAPTGGGTYPVNTPVNLGGSISDYDGGSVNYQWLEGDAVLNSGAVQATLGGMPVTLPTFSISTLPVGVHNLTLQANDGDNSASGTISVTIVQPQDTQAPTLAPVVDKPILWPPNHLMAPVTIQANAVDNSGQPVTLWAVVSCNELQPGVVDWTEPVIDQVNGIIILSLRADRFSKGKGRVYTITITATDMAGNASTANVTVMVPHDQGKK
ncbi:MAG: hypothetical protein HY913_00070 [Desulfomonile tiedjei]|nr:hypothetical protein [Desulfomonile tiedjei]